MRVIFLIFPAAILMLAVAACGGGPEADEGKASASASPEGSPKETADAVADFPEMTPFSAQLQDKLHQIRAKVAEIRGLPIHPSAQEGVVSRESLAQYGRDQFASLEGADAIDAAAS